MNSETEYDNALRSFLTSVKRTAQLRKNNLRMELDNLVKDAPLQERRKLTTFILTALEEWEDDMWNAANAFGRSAKLCVQLALREDDADR